MAGEHEALTHDEAAAWLHVSVQTVRRLAESRHLDEVQVADRAVRVRATSVDRLVGECFPWRRWVRRHRPLCAIASAMHC